MPISRTDPDRYEEGMLFATLAEAVVMTQEAVTQTFDPPQAAVQFVQRFYSWRVAMRHRVGELRAEGTNPDELTRTEQMLLFAEGVKIQHRKHSPEVTIAPLEVKVPPTFAKFIKDNASSLVTDTWRGLGIDND